MKVGILTWHYFCNFGSALQAYALQKYLESAGHTVKIINYRDSKFNSTKDVKRAVLYLISKVAGRKYYNPYLEFQIEYMKETRRLEKGSIDDFLKKKRGWKADAVICGSDQIWAPNLYDPVYMGDFLQGGGEKDILCCKHRPS